MKISVFAFLAVNYFLWAVLFIYLFSENDRVTNLENKVSIISGELADAFDDLEIQQYKEDSDRHGIEKNIKAWSINMQSRIDILYDLIIGDDGSASYICYPK